MDDDQLRSLEDKILSIERAIAAGGLTAAVKIIVERLDKFQRELDVMASNQGNLIRYSNHVAVAFNKLQKTLAATTGIAGDDVEVDP